MDKPTFGIIAMVIFGAIVIIFLQARSQKEKLVNGAAHGQ
jgi:hypothetical protein